MKKIILMLVALSLAFVTSFALASPASAKDVDGKEQTICHYTDEHASHQYNKITVSVNSIVSDNGHGTHPNDIIAAFDYYEKVDHEWVLRHFDGLNTDKVSLLQYEDCQAPVVDNKIAAPVVNVNDPCATKNDSVTPVASDKYTATVTQNGLVYTVVANATAGNVFDPAQSTGWTLTNDNKTATKVFTLTAEDCGLPNTGQATTNVVGGVAVVALLAALGVFLLRRRTTA